jgi:hypothetical protein
MHITNQNRYIGHMKSPAVFHGSMLGNPFAKTGTREYDINKWVEIWMTHPDILKRNVRKYLSLAFGLVGFLLFGFFCFYFNETALETVFGIPMMLSFVAGVGLAAFFDYGSEYPESYTPDINYIDTFKAWRVYKATTP